MEPVPKPRTMPEETYSTALSAASVLRSSCVKVFTGVGAEKALMVRWRVGVRVVVALWWRKVESGGRVRKDREAMVVVVGGWCVVCLSYV